MSGIHIGFLNKSPVISLEMYIGHKTLKVELRLVITLAHHSLSVGDQITLSEEVITAFSID
mgnify:CR=1 FL=1